MVRIEGKTFSNTCIFPIKRANNTSPKMAIRMANDVSPIKVVVDKFCPYELRQKESKYIRKQIVFRQTSCMAENILSQ
jgi:hypothetical protein